MKGRNPMKQFFPLAAAFALCGATTAQTAQPPCLTPAEFTAHMNDPDAFVGLHPLALMSHLACADTPSHPLNKTQLERFISALSTFRLKFGDARGSLANSTSTNTC